MLVADWPPPPRPRLSSCGSFCAVWKVSYAGASSHSHELFAAPPVPVDWRYRNLHGNALDQRRLVRPRSLAAFVPMLKGSCFAHARELEKNDWDVVRKCGVYFKEFLLKIFGD